MRYGTFRMASSLPSSIAFHRSDRFPASINIKVSSRVRESKRITACHQRLSQPRYYLQPTIPPTSLLFFWQVNTVVTLDSSFNTNFASHSKSPHNLPNCTFLNFNLDCFLTGNNTRRLRKMLIQARWDEMRQKMQVVKNAYVSRHYTQCAKYGERLLAEVQGEVSDINMNTINPNIC